jgi:AraC-like DNA-binding protein
MAESMYHADMPESRFLFSNDRPGRLGTLRVAGVQYGSRGVSPRPFRVLGTYALVLVTGGGGRYLDAAGHRQKVGEGDVVVVFPELGHSYGPSARGDWDEVYMTFEGPVFDTLRTCGVLSSDRPVLTSPPGWGERMDAVVHRLRPPFTDAAVLEFVALLVDLSPEAEPPQEGSWLAAAKVLLGTDLARTLDLEPAAVELGISSEAFRKRFTREAGISPGRYRAQRRIEAAATLLRQTRMTHRQIAESLGFTDEFHLSKRFREAMGVTPREWRKGED